MEGGGPGKQGGKRKKGGEADALALKKRIKVWPPLDKSTALPSPSTAPRAPRLAPHRPVRLPLPPRFASQGVEEVLEKVAKLAEATRRAEAAPGL